MTERLDILAQTATKLSALEMRARLAQSNAPTDIGWELLGRVKELRERCSLLHELSAHAASKAVAELVIAVVALERSAGGAVMCEQHPEVLATDLWGAAPVCEPCRKRLQNIRG